MKRKTKHDNLEALLITVPQGKKNPQRQKNLILRKKHPGGKKPNTTEKGGKTKPKGLDTTEN